MCWRLSPGCRGERVVACSKAVMASARFHVTPTLNPSPRGRDLPSPLRAPMHMYRAYTTDEQGNIYRKAAQIHQLPEAPPPPKDPPPKPPKLPPEEDEPELPDEEEYPPP